MVAIPTELEAALERLYGTGKSAQSQCRRLETRVDELDFDADVAATERPRVRSAGHPPGEPAHHHALETRASDIHVEPFEDRLTVRYRIDGVLHDVESPPQAARPPR